MNIKKVLSGVLMGVVIATNVVSGNVMASNSNPSSNSSVAKEKRTFEKVLNETEDTITIKDLRGKEITLKKQPKKVVCAYNSYLDLWYKSGGTVVGKVEESKDKPVPEAKDAVNVGTASTPSIEMILDLDADLVILSPSFKAHREIADQLEAQGVEVLMVDAVSFDEYLFVSYLFTQLNGRPDLYEKIGTEVENNIEAVIEKVPTDKKYTAAIMFASPKAITLRTSKTTVGEMVHDLGVENIADKATEEEQISFSMEELIKEDPDFIFVQTMGTDMEKVKEVLKKDAESNEAWKTLKAVKEGRYIILPKDLYLYKANDRYAEAYLKLAQRIYPEVYGKLVE